MRSVLWFIVGFVLAVLLARAPMQAGNQQSQVMLGNSSGVAVAIAVDASGNVKIALN